MIIDGYDITRQIGRGSQGETVLATGADGEPVAIKRLSFANMSDWKSLELFEREIAALRQADHAGIPRFIDAIRDEDAWYLVQEFVDGDDLSKRSEVLPEPELTRLANDMLDVLEYLHGLVPPLIHRDIKPSNIVQRAEGSFVLVDFGGVQRHAASDVGGSTVIGTTGYMPAEQLVGRAVPQSDLYALGATLVHLATSIHPAELPTVRLKLDWRDQSELSGPLAAAIDAMLAPAPEDRPASAAEARAMIAGLPAVVQSAAIVAQGPCPSHIMRRFRFEQDLLIIALDDRDDEPFAISPWLVALMACAMGLIASSILVMFLVGLFGMAVLVVAEFAPKHAREKLSLRRDGTYQYQRLGGANTRRLSGAVTQAVEVTSNVVTFGDDLAFGEGLRADERAWIGAQITRWLDGE